MKDARTKSFDDDLEGSEYLTSKARASCDKALYTIRSGDGDFNVYAGPSMDLGVIEAILTFYLDEFYESFLRKSARLIYSRVCGLCGDLENIRTNITDLMFPEE